MCVGISFLPPPKQLHSMHTQGIAATHFNNEKRKKSLSSQHTDLQLSPKTENRRKYVFPTPIKKKRQSPRSLSQSSIPCRDVNPWKKQGWNKSPFHAHRAPLRNNYENCLAGLAFGAFTAFLPINSSPGSDGKGSPLPLFPLPPLPSFLLAFFTT